ncbi:hypothetical protein DENIT_11991 [Pseudomonas veronii]|nr:hypothetical protein DENIT_11991 [Pseudomonas veronii]
MTQLPRKPVHEFKHGRFWPWANGRQITRALRLGAEIVRVFRFHRFELAVREAGAWAHMRCSMALIGVPKMTTGTIWSAR